MSLRFVNKYFNLTKNETYFVITVFVFILSFLSFTFYGPNYNGSRRPVYLTVKNGASFNTVVDSLYKKNVIKSKTNIKIAAFLFGLEKSVKAGKYQIPDGINYINLLTLLNKGAPKKQIRVTIQEGIWQKDLAKLLSNKLKLNKKEILRLSKDKKFIKELGLNINSLEGYLLPDTYYFYEGSTEKEVLEKLVDAMTAVFNNAKIKVRMKEINMNMHMILTMASIIDGESNKVNEFKRIAGVYYNRLRKRWKLQADPTVQYVVRQKRKKVNKIYYKDLEIDSKFNTYKYYGLPPAPINNPGKDAIMAALYPEEHEYFYFVADGSGGHAFSRNSREHQIQVNRYRNWRRNSK